MSLSSEEQIAVAMHLASSGAKAKDIQKQLKAVCGNTTVPEQAIQEKVVEKQKVEKKEEPPTVKRIFKKMKMVKEGGCWKPVFVDTGCDEDEEGDK